MAQDFNIRITAVDKATKVVNKVNESVGKMFRPYESAKKSTASFFNALGKNDLVAKPLWALQKIGGGLSSVATSFGIAENSVIGGSARMAASLGAIGGPIGAFVGGAAVIVGATTAVAVRMGQLGFGIQRTAKNLNVTTDHLQEYRGAAKLAGLETETMDSSMGALGTTLQDALAGRNLQAATLLSQMGISIKKTKDGAVDTVQALRDISDVVSRVKDQNMARKISDMLGVGELLPMLREGTKQLDDWIAQVRRAGGVMSTDLVDANKKQADSWNQTKAAIDGMGTSLGNLLAQYVHLDDFASGVSKIASSTKEWADKKTSTDKGGDKPSVVRSSMVGGLLSGPVGAGAGALFGLISKFGAKATPQGSRSFSGSITNADGTTVSDNSAGAGRGRAQVPAADASAPRGIRNNNPGNLNYAGQAGASKEGGPGGRFAVFATPEAGITAAAKNLMAYQDKYGINTIEKIIKRWAPSTENDTSAYISTVSKQTGIKSDQPLDLRDPKILAPLISSIIKHENGQNPYDAETIAKAAAAAVRESQGNGSGEGGQERPIRLEVIGLPPGMSIKAVRGLGQTPVGMTMQPGGTS
ncbi:hypothetical protein [Variovorax sp. N23]|uniref:hypothetical protein n=1 Tax=Variovorax sp. N23 TaxID=2980555 RepID=UPI0021C9DD7D|nr:hypothetical protein [Variovorax sp. N23]MCU4119293.1 hypothetical protein [Variovorax sp. N23]